jgi:hypothetical protein
VKNYEPVMSFGEDVAAMYDDHIRGDESATVALLEQLARGGPALGLCGRTRPYQPRRRGHQRAQHGPDGAEYPAWGGVGRQILGRV